MELKETPFGRLTINFGEGRLVATANCRFVAELASELRAEANYIQETLNYQVNGLGEAQETWERWEIGRIALETARLLERLRQIGNGKRSKYGD